MRHAYEGIFSPPPGPPLIVGPRPARYIDFLYKMRKLGRPEADYYEGNHPVKICVFINLLWGARCIYDMILVRVVLDHDRGNRQHEPRHLIWAGLSDCLSIVGFKPANKFLGLGEVCV